MDERRVFSYTKQLNSSCKNLFSNNKQIIMRRQTHNQNQKQKAQPQNHHNNHPQKNKISHSFPSLNHQDEEDSNTPVPVYLHSHNKKSLKLQLGPQISISDLKKIIEDRIGIKKDRQLLYLNGKNITEYGHIRLKTNSIIHISDSNEICDSNQQIHLKLTIMNFVEQNQQKISKKYIVQPNERILDFLFELQKELSVILNLLDQEVYYCLLESSRLLEKQKTFQEQDITRQTDIICMITKHEVKTRFTNDTKQEILHDISELLGFGEEVQAKSEPKNQERSIRPRYCREEVKRPQVPSQPEQEQSFNQSSSLSLPNFKKKRSPLNKASSLEELPNSGLAKKIKASKTKRDLDFILNSQQKQKNVFQYPQVIKEQAKQEEVRQEQPKVKGKIENDTPKPTPSIPKVMPINQRRQIRLEIEKLFDFGDNSSETKPLPSQLSDTIKPISPPTQMPKQRQKMRLSLGSRPAFLDQLKNLKLSDD